MTLPTQLTNGKTRFNCECGGEIEFWEERVFETVFQVMGCSKCVAFWAWVEDENHAQGGEWMDSTHYWEYFVMRKNLN
jgi:hypothetical protein